MANFFNTRVHKMKEAIGAVQPTADPTPVIEVKEHMKNVKENISNLQRSSKQLSTDYSKAAQAGDKLGESFLEFSKLYEKSPLGEVLSRMGEVQIALNALEHAYSSETIEILASPLKRIQDEELKKAFDLKTKQESARVAYDVVLNKQREFNLKSDGKPSSKSEELEQSLNTAKASYDTLNQQLINRLNDFDQEASSQMIGNILTFLRAQYEHYTKAATLLSEVIPQFENYSAQNQQFIQQMKEHSHLLKQQQQQQQQQLQRQSIQNQQKLILQQTPNPPNIVIHNPPLPTSSSSQSQPPIPNRSSQQYSSNPLSNSGNNVPFYPNLPSTQAPVYQNMPNNNNNNNAPLYPTLNNQNFFV